MKFSVLMSVYKNDDAEFLKLALESIYDKQTLKPDEIVVVFDGELTEELYAVLDDFKKGKEEIVKYFPQEKNLGLGEALRIGAEKCTGEYILRMDADDISYPERFEKQCEWVKNHPETDVLGTNISEFKFSPDEGDMRVRICPEQHSEIAKMGKRRSPMNHVTVCMKKSALEKSGGYENLFAAEDYYLWMKMLANGCRLENLNESLVYVRIGNGFDQKRAYKEQIGSWYKLQKYMLKNKQINVFDSVVNMVYIIAFTYAPSFLRRGLYSRLLRK